MLTNITQFVAQANIQARALPKNCSTSGGDIHIPAPSPPSQERDLRKSDGGDNNPAAPGGVLVRPSYPRGQVRCAPLQFREDR